MKDLFTEFLALSWKGHGSRTSSLEDVILGNYIIARISYSGITVIWLANGNKLKIPWEWVDLFSSLNTIYGDQILWNRDKEGLDRVDRIICKFTLLINQFNWNKGEDFLNTLADICDLGTKDFIEWYYTESGEKLEPIKLITANETIKI